MNLAELYAQTPAAKHPEIVVTGDRLFYQGGEYVIDGNEELKLIRSQEKLEQDLALIKSKLDIS